MLYRYVHTYKYSILCVCIYIQILRKSLVLHGFVDTNSSIKLSGLVVLNLLSSSVIIQLPTTVDCFI